MKSNTQRALRQASLVARHLRSLELGKKHYKKSDVAMDEIEKLMKPGEAVVIGSGRFAGKKFKLVDKFEGRNRINVGLNARRYEFEEVIEA